MNRLISHEAQRRYEFMLESAHALGDLALQMLQTEVGMRMKPDGKVTDIDLALNQAFIERTAKAFPKDLVWGEEGSNSEKGDLSTTERRWMWTLDSIDGTDELWRCYNQKYFGECTTTSLIAGFAPGETTPTIGMVINPFQSTTSRAFGQPKWCLLSHFVCSNTTIHPAIRGSDRVSSGTTF